MIGKFRVNLLYLALGLAWISGSKRKIRYESLCLQSLNLLLLRLSLFEHYLDGYKDMVDERKGNCCIDLALYHTMRLMLGLFSGCLVIYSLSRS